MLIALTLRETPSPRSTAWTHAPFVLRRAAHQGPSPAVRRYLCSKPDAPAKRTKKNGKVSLYPLSFEEALRGLLSTPPTEKHKGSEGVSRQPEVDNN